MRQIVRYRNYLGLTQQDFADILNISKQSYWNKENGKTNLWLRTSEFSYGNASGKKSGCFIVHGLLFALLSRWHSWVSGIGRRNGQCAGVISGYDEYALYGNDSLGWLSACDL